MKHARILVLDDEQETVEMLQTVLLAQGYLHVRAATDPRQLMQLYHQFQPDLILLDLMMPLLDGFEVLAQLRSFISGENHLPVLVLTADPSLESKRRALGAGAKDYVTKPFDHVETLLRIQNLLEIHYVNQDLQRRNHLLEHEMHLRG